MIISKPFDDMLTTRQKSLSLSGGGIVCDLSVPSYSPNANTGSGGHFPWEEEVNDINTPDIDPSFFDVDPFKKYKSQTSLVITNFLTEDNFFNANTLTDESTDQLCETMTLSQLMSQTNVDISALMKDSEQTMVAPNDVLEEQYISATTTAPVLHYLQPKPIDSMATTLTLDEMTNTSLIDSNANQTQESFAQSFGSPSHSSISSSQQFSPSFTTINQTYLSPTPSPPLSYTSSTSHTTLVSMDPFTTSDSNITVESKPEPEFLQPTVINDHLYHLPSTSGTRKRKASTDKDDKYLTVRKKNNMASKKSRGTKRDKQKEMDSQIQHYIEDNAKCKQMIAQMEREIDWCKNYLFRKVVASAAPQKT